MEIPLSFAITILCILLSIIFFLWRAKKSETSQLTDLQASLAQSTEDNQQLTLKLAVTEEKLAAISHQQTDYQQIQQQLLNCKTENTELQTRWQEQQKNNQEKIKLLQSRFTKYYSRCEDRSTKIYINFSICKV